MGIEYLEVELAGLVEKVVISTLLTTSPTALVQGAYGVSPTMQRYMKAQSVASGGDGNLGGMNQAVLEINPKHPIVQELNRMVKSDKESIDTKNYAQLMYDIACMKSGYDVEDTASFASRVMNIMSGNKPTVAEVTEDEVAQDSVEVTEDKEAQDSAEPIEPEVVQ